MRVRLRSLTKDYPMGRFINEVYMLLSSVVLTAVSVVGFLMLSILFFGFFVVTYALFWTFVRDVEGAGYTEETTTNSREVALTTSTKDKDIYNEAS